MVNIIHMTADGEHTRVRILGEARDLYLETGLVHFSLREVARRVGVSAPAVYRHYDNKEALLRAVCTEGFRVFSDYLLAALGAKSPRERLARAAEQYLRFGLEHPHDYRFIFMSSPVDVRAIASGPRTPALAPTFQFLVDRVRECMQAHVLRRSDPEEIATQIWAHVHGLVSLRVSGHLARLGDDAAFSRFYHNAVEKLLTGLAP